jgi:hypothetical protein
MATSLVIRRATASLVAMFMSRMMPARPGAWLDVEARLITLEAKEEIRSVLMELARLVDEGLLSGLSKLEPRLDAGFAMRVVDLAGTERRYVGAKGMVDAYAPIMASGRSKLIASAISVDVAGDRATASFKLAGSVSSSPELGLPVGRTLLLISGHSATLRREGGVWTLMSLELAHAMVDGAPPKGAARSKAAGTSRSRGKRAARS